MILRYAANRLLLDRELPLAGKTEDTEYTDALHDLVIRAALKSQLQLSCFCSAVLISSS